MAIRPDRVAAYVRWSTDDQATGTTLDVQRDGCTHYVQSQGWRWRDDLLFVDDGHSGGTLDRPAVQRLRAAVRRGEVDCVVVYKIDRLSRNIVDATQLVLREWRGTCHLKSVLEPIDTTTDMGRMIFGILAMFADFERSAIRERTQGGKVRRIRDGQQMHGRPAFGYAPHPREKGRWVENPEQAPVVRRMFRLVADGMSANQIVRLFNAEGTPTPTGRHWSLPSVLHVLHNRTYAGVVEYGRTSLVRPETGGESGEAPRQWRVRHDEPRVRTETRAVPVLVPPEVFDGVQSVLAQNRARLYEVGGRAMASPHLLVGITQCACGTPLVHKSAGPSHPRRARYYLCPGHRAGTCTAHGSIPAREAEDLVQQAFLALFGIREVGRERLMRGIAAADDDQTALAATLEMVRRDLRRLDEEAQRVLRAARTGEIPFSALGDLRESILRDRADAESRLRGVEERREGAASRVRAFRATLDSLEPMALWESLEVWRRRQMLRMCLDGRITMTKAPGQDGITISAPWTAAG